MYVIKMLITLPWQCAQTEHISRGSHFMSMSVYCRPPKWQYWKQFSMYLRDSQIISGRRTNQHAYSTINKSATSWAIELKWWVYTKSSFSHVNAYAPLNSGVCVCPLLSECMQRASLYQHGAPCPGMWSTDRLHHVPPLNHETCSTQG